MKEIQLTQNQIALIDDEDYEIVMNHKWFALRVRKTNKYYAATNIRIDGKRETLRLHKLLLNPPKTYLIDHIDGNGLNCTRINMRICTPTENTHNRGRDIDNTTGFKGVCKLKYNRFQATITFKGKQLYLGCYKSAIEAAIAYNNAAIKYHKQFANLNKIPDDKNN